MIYRAMQNLLFFELLKGLRLREVGRTTTRSARGRILIVDLVGFVEAVIVPIPQFT
jgi:hypothetical protein